MSAQYSSQVGRRSRSQTSMDYELPENRPALVTKSLVLSLYHLTKMDQHLLKEAVNDGDPLIFQNDEGFVLMLADDCHVRANRLTDTLSIDHVLKWAKLNGCQMLVFSSAAPIASGFDLYD